MSGGPPDGPDEEFAVHFAGSGCICVPGSNCWPVSDSMAAPLERRAAKIQARIVDQASLARAMSSPGKGRAAHRASSFSLLGGRGSHYI